MTINYRKEIDVYIFFCKLCNRDREFELDWTKFHVRDGKIEFSWRCSHPNCKYIHRYTQLSK